MKVANVEAVDHYGLPKGQRRRGDGEGELRTGIVVGSARHAVGGELHGGRVASGVDDAKARFVAHRRDVIGENDQRGRRALVGDRRRRENSDRLEAVGS